MAKSAEKNVFIQVGYHLMRKLFYLRFVHIGNRKQTALWCMDMAFNDDHMRARTKNAANNLAAVKQLVINLIRSDTVKRKGGIKVRRLIAAADTEYCRHLMQW